jgi:hypothetical protein
LKRDKVAEDSAASIAFKASDLRRNGYHSGLFLEGGKPSCTGPKGAIVGLDQGP